MAARIVIADVKAILDDTTVSSTNLAAYITSANVLVNAHLIGKGLSDAELKEIERWVAAHMVASSRERQMKKAGAGGAEVEYTGYWSYGLTGTSYGQTAIALDRTGTLQALITSKGNAWSRAVKS